MPNYWLLKTEPSTYSYADLERDGKTVWDGVTNALALKHLRSMKRGDLAFVYHTGAEKQIVGIAGVVRNPYPDPKESEPKLVVVDLMCTLSDSGETTAGLLTAALTTHGMHAAEKDVRGVLGLPLRRAIAALLHSRGSASDRARCAYSGVRSAPLWLRKERSPLRTARLRATGDSRARTATACCIPSRRGSGRSGLPGGRR